MINSYHQEQMSYVETLSKKNKALRVVICDSLGSVIRALSEWNLLPTSTAAIEALACRRVVVFAKDLSIFNSVIEGDAEVIIKVLLA